VFNHEGLIVYKFARELDALVAGVLDRKSKARGLSEQLDRSTASIALNIAEGAGRTTPVEKRRFYAIARGSATETAAALDLLHGRHAISDAEYKHARSLLLNLVRILSKLSAPPSDP
jgi:four helix bundle protein